MNNILHHYQDLITIFYNCFAKDYNTRLVKGDNEPIYLPADEHKPYHTLCFAHGYFSSALHECAHWLIAGEARRKQVDFGYWYIPDGRNAEQQTLFQHLEVKPQALEWVLSKACGHKFHISIDNLHGEESDREYFAQAVFNQVRLYCMQGLSVRAHKFREALCCFYKQPPVLNDKDFSMAEII